MKKPSYYREIQSATVGDAERLLKSVIPESTYEDLLERYIENPGTSKSWIAVAFRKIATQYRKWAF